MIKRVYLEITNKCNLKCAFCARHHRAPENMSPAFFESLLPQVKNYTDYIYLHVQGEPLLHPDFETIMNLCDQYGMKVQLVTNGSLLYLHPSLLDHSSLRKLSVSLQSAPFQNGDMNQLKDVLTQMMKQASAAEHPTVEIRFWRDDVLARDHAQKILQYLQDHYTFVPSVRKANYQIMPHVFVDFDNAFSWPGQEETVPCCKGRCHGAVDQIAILSDGTLVPCCLDYDGHIAFGNLHEASLAALLSSRRYLDMVKGIRSHMLVEPYCQQCTFHHRFD
ncbi:MAG: radical SAM protein [Lactimicrobium sp.]|jgi:radical SAM protein with 4Fe4S-binding SPASM domain|uniref:radical SAM/SPASM domain-containing protein n=1 Tax=Lactimicrobium sp. TaxID=2563780 RepID=UPI002F355020